MVFLLTSILVLNPNIKTTDSCPLITHTISLEAAKFGSWCQHSLALFTPPPPPFFSLMNSFFGAESLSGNGADNIIDGNV